MQWTALTDIATQVFRSKTLYEYSKSFNPLSPNSDENEIPLYIITTCSSIQVMRIEEMIIKDKMS